MSLDRKILAPIRQVAISCYNAHPEVVEKFIDLAQKSDRYTLGDGGVCRIKIGSVPYTLVVKKSWRGNDFVTSTQILSLAETIASEETVVHYTEEEANRG